MLDHFARWLLRTACATEGHRFRRTEQYETRILYGLNMRYYRWECTRCHQFHEWAPELVRFVNYLA